MRRTVLFLTLCIYSPSFSLLPFSRHVEGTPRASLRGPRSNSTTLSVKLGTTSCSSQFHSPAMVLCGKPSVLRSWLIASVSTSSFLVMMLRARRRPPLHCPSFSYVRQPRGGLLEPKFTRPSTTSTAIPSLWPNSSTKPSSRLRIPAAIQSLRLTRLYESVRLLSCRYFTPSLNVHHC